MAEVPMTVFWSFISVFIKAIAVKALPEQVGDVI